MTRNAFAARTPDPRLPIEKTAPDVVPAEILARGAELVVGLEAAHDERALLLGEELGRVREVLDDPERRRARDDGDEALEDEDPRPRRLAPDAVHVRYRGLHAECAMPRERALRVARGEREARTARRPPNAPETVAAEKKTAARMPNSERLYQLYGGCARVSGR